jgi:hypothetical protein
MDSTMIWVEPWVMMVRLMVEVMAWSITCTGVSLALLAESFANAVEHHYRLVDRIAQYRQHSRQNGQRELPLEKGEKPQNDDHIVQVGDDGRDGIFPFETGKPGKS